MEFPQLTSFLNDRQAAQFASIAEAFEKAVADKHIWNTDYQTGKDFLSRRVEEAVEKLKNQQRGQRDENYKYPTWDNNDPRWQTIYTTSFLNYPGLVKRLQKYKDDPVVVPYLPLYTEIAKLAELVKSVKPFIEKGRKPNPNAKPVDLTNMGTCAICVKLQKLHKNKTMVDHGYQISDGYGHYFGFRSGHCFGVGYEPYELSCEANKQYVAVLKENLVKVEVRHADLQNGKVTEIVRMEQKWVKDSAFGRYVQTPVTYTTESKEWRGVLDLEIREIEYAIRAVKDEIAANEKRIEKWVRKPLPDEVK